MQEEPNNNISSHFDDEIDIKEIFDILFLEKRTIICLTAFISIVAVIFSLLLPNIFESRAILSPVESSSNVSSALQNFSGISRFAGINLPSSSETNTLQAIEKIQSLSFFENNFLPNIFLPDLMALKSWNFQTNTLEYDQKLYDINASKWIRKYDYPQRLIPSSQESFEEFMTKHFKLIEDKDTGFITLSIKHKSPYIAKEWAELMVDQINLYYREKDKFSSNKTITFLNKEIVKTDLTEIKQTISQLIQDETKKLALIEVNKNYIFDFIDPPAVMEKKSAPKRALICILAAIFGAILSIGYILIKNYVFNKKVLT